MSANYNTALHEQDQSRVRILPCVFSLFQRQVFSVHHNITDVGTNYPLILYYFSSGHWGLENGQCEGHSYPPAANWLG